MKAKWKAHGYADDPGPAAGMRPAARLLGMGIVELIEPAVGRAMVMELEVDDDRRVMLRLDLDDTEAIAGMAARYREMLS